MKRDVKNVIGNYVNAMMDRDEQIKLTSYEDNQALQDLLNLYNSLQ